MLILKTKRTNVQGKNTVSNGYELDVTFRIFTGCSQKGAVSGYCTISFTISSNKNATTLTTWSLSLSTFLSGIVIIKFSRGFFITKCFLVYVNELNLFTKFSNFKVKYSLKKTHLHAVHGR